MSTSIKSNLDFNNVSRLINLPSPSDVSEAATKGYVDSAIEGLNWKQSVRVATQGNVNLVNPSGTIDGVSMVQGDRILVKSQTVLSENGIYVFNSGSSPLVRAIDSNIFSELEQAIVFVSEGTSSDKSFRQTQVNGVINTNDIVWVSFGVSTPLASESTSGIAELASQAETDSGVNDSSIVTPLKLSNWSGRIKKVSSNIGDGTSTSFVINHNFNTRDVKVEVFYATGSYSSIIVDTSRSSVNSVTLVFSSPPSVNQFRVVIMG